ncbi:hypothetical protein NQ318_006855 [Aromia moschata]|uniref:SLC41A/MgtE integral membrane domain-containing protein n=1 Tax=Aromia moschata TaxID=1265417 RepID=A0AAV8YLG6_9CUCU|nr:hypothetical protein NQ318_006855 [Aromia moschata]
MDESNHYNESLRHRKLYDKSYLNASRMVEGENEIDDDSGDLSDTCVLLNRGDTLSKTDVVVVQKEPLWATAIQMFIPFLLAGFEWFKGQFRNDLASRLSTHANLGDLDDRKQKLSLITGNLALILCQAIVVGFLASLAAVIFGWVPTGVINMKHVLLLCASSIVTAFGASFILGLVMIGVIIFSRYFNINPDNVATPIAASLGDLTTLACLSLIVLGLVLVPVWAWIASQNEHTHKVLFSGWSPVIMAMVISSIGGLILDFTVAQFKGVAVFQLVINGVGGNLVAVQASRISTELHSLAKPGQLPEHMQVMTLSMWKHGVDPDNSAIPYLTALGDLLGTLLLGTAFQFLYIIGDGDSDVGD